LFDAVVESLIEHCHNERVLWDVNRPNTTHTRRRRLFLAVNCNERAAIIALIAAPVDSKLSSAVSNAMFRKLSSDVSKINIYCHFIARVSHDTRATLVAKS